MPEPLKLEDLDLGRIVVSVGDCPDGDNSTVPGIVLLVDEFAENASMVILLSKREAFRLVSLLNEAIIETIGEPRQDRSEAEDW